MPRTLPTISSSRTHNRWRTKSASYVCTSFAVSSFRPRTRTAKWAKRKDKYTQVLTKMNIWIHFLCVFQSDPFVQIEVGKTKADNRDKYIPNSVNPEFGRWKTSVAFWALFCLSSSTFFSQIECSSSKWSCRSRRICAFASRTTIWSAQTR